MNIQSLDISMLLKAERVQCKLGLEDVAQVIGVSASYVFRIEKGSVSPAKYVVHRLIKLFDIDEGKLALYRYPDDTRKLLAPSNAEAAKVNAPIDHANVLDFESIKKMKEMIKG